MSDESAVNSRSSTRFHAGRIAFAMPACLWVLAVSLAASAPRPAEKPQATVTCGSCHAGIATSFRNAPMRHAMEPDGANPMLSAHPDLALEQGPYHYKVQTRNGHSTYSVSDGTGSVTLPIRWIFGQHTQTWVLEKDGQFYESLVSFFPRDNTLATTPGDQRIEPRTLEEAMGRRLPVWEARACFECHATGVGSQLDVAKIVPGLECEHCHQGSGQHLADAAHDNFRTLPASLKNLDAEQVSNFCGQCHRTFDTVMRNRWHGPAFVRFQPYRLELSRCFVGNDARIGCLACHDPHQPLNRSTSYYDSKCLACHARPSPSSAMKSCPVAEANCTSCHMPKVELPGGHATFTDHYIRIVRPNEPYPE